ncbi:unnamed protein product [Adineta steineri]|uniref:Uncharacterized protein n=1 Tax=Adineta steineri TaxID=433720 RepID=A0A814EKN8_9BILA|nr:unnamed protein product [Adineta steineri]
MNKLKLIVILVLFGIVQTRQIGSISNHVFSYELSTNDFSITFQNITSCNVCICAAFMSTINYVAINCYKTNNTCLLIAFSANITGIISSQNNSLYILPGMPMSLVPANSSASSPSTSAPLTNSTPSSASSTPTSNSLSTSVSSTVSTNTNSSSSITSSTTSTILNPAMPSNTNSSSSNTTTTTLNNSNSSSTLLNPAMPSSTNSSSSNTNSTTFTSSILREI